ncbi:MAG: hypothetical protein HJJLKODD_02640 [Phycisphaerae bacterium]|nr:hypothetical protein [Phycisphaerae bacterium]
MSESSREQSGLSLLEVVVLLMIGCTLLGVCFLTSPPPGRAHDGALTWQEGSSLHQLTDWLAFNFKIPTADTIGIKWLIGGVMSALAIIVVALARFLAIRSREREFYLDEGTTTPVATLKKQIDPLAGAQLLLVLFVILSFLSALWSAISMLALGGSLILLGHIFWALAIRFGLNQGGTRWAVIILVTTLLLTALLGIWYATERNPSARMMGYPIGNTLFFAASMLPAILLSLAGIGAAVVKLRKQRSGIALIFAALLVVVVTGWAFQLTDSRGGMVGLAAGCAAMLILAISTTRNRLIALALIGVIGLAGYLIWLQPRIAERNDSVRSRLYAWTYAQELFAESPIFGHGQGSYSLLADSRAVEDVDEDPLPLKNYNHHAHNEWLELLADLGSIGMVMFVGSLLLTFLAATQALHQPLAVGQRWLIIGLASSLAAMCAEETFDVALQIAPFPIIFYTVWGLLWAAIASALPRPWSAEWNRKAAWQTPLLFAVIIPALVLLAGTISDFHANRAHYSVDELLKQRQWTAANAAAEQSWRYRLYPMRRIFARLDHVRTQLTIAHAYLNDYARVLATLQQESMPNEKLRQQAQEYRQQAINYADQAHQQVGEWIALAPALMGAHESAAQANEIHCLLAQLEGRVEEYEAYRQVIVKHYEQELRREPFNAQLVISLLSYAPADIPLSEVINLMCPPMRSGDLPESYFTLYQNLAQQPDLDRDFSPLLNQALASMLPNNSTTQPANPFAPEILRIGSWVAYHRGNLPLAVNYSEAAMQLSSADTRRKIFPYAAAINARELGFLQFSANPNDPQTAVTTTRRSNDYLPGGFEAESIRQRTGLQLVLLLLAAGDEPAADQELPGAQALSQEGMMTELSQQYYRLCSMLMSLPPPLRPGYLADRLQRFDALMLSHPFSTEAQPVPPVWLAQYYWENQQVDQALAQVERALERFGPIQPLQSMIQQMATQLPNHAVIIALQQKLAELSGDTTASQPTSLPSSSSAPVTE